MPTEASMCPLITSDSAAAAPLYGTCTISIPAFILKSSMERCGDAPTPEEPKLTLPGCALAYATNSFRVRIGIEGCTMKTFGTPPIIAGKAKSPIGS